MPRQGRAESKPCDLGWEVPDKAESIFIKLSPHAEGFENRMFGIQFDIDPFWFSRNRYGKP